MRKIIKLILILFVFQNTILTSDNSDLLKQKISTIQGEWSIIDKFYKNPAPGVSFYKDKNIIIQGDDVILSINSVKQVFFELYSNNVYEDRSKVDLIISSYELLLVGKNNIYSGIMSNDLKNNNYVERIIMYGSDYKSIIWEPLYYFIILGEDKMLLNDQYILERVK